MAFFEQKGAKGAKPGLGDFLQKAAKDAKSGLDGLR